ncbi:MAG: hypothetical protein ACO3YY_03015 [Phycisphaerales bacterium]
MLETFCNPQSRALGFMYIVGQDKAISDPKPTESSTQITWG